MSAHTLAIIAICTTFAVGMGLIFRLGCDGRPRNDEPTPEDPEMQMAEGALPFLP